MRRVCLFCVFSCSVIRSDRTAARLEIPRPCRAISQRSTRMRLFFFFGSCSRVRPGAGIGRAEAGPAAARGAGPHHRSGFRCSAYRAAADAGACGPRGTLAPPASAPVPAVWGWRPVHAGPSSASRISLRCLVSRQNIQAACRSTSCSAHAVHTGAPVL
jgi:hypothetical protein